MRILLAEDDDETAGHLESGLSELGHAVVRATDGEAALELGISERFDVIVLDRMMPKREGLDVLRRLRAVGVGTPILLLTAKGGIGDRVDGLDAGADDYVVKPFAFSELVARMNALIRRAPSSDTATRIEVGDIVLDLLRRTVTRASRPIALQPREFTLLEVRMRHAGKVVSSTMVYEQVWCFHFDPQPTTCSIPQWRPPKPK